MKTKALMLALLPSLIYADHAYHASGEWLYWNARQDGLEYAIGDTLSLMGSHADVSAKKHNLGFNWDPGVRASIGCTFDCRWSLDLVGVYLTSKTKSSASVPFNDPSQFLNPIWFESFMGFKTQIAEASWHLDFATIDLLGSCHLHPWSCCVLSPYLGLRGVQIKQKYDVVYTNNSFANNMTVLAFPRSNLDFSSRYLAVGLTGGAEVNFPFCDFYSFTGSLGGSVVYGKSTVLEAATGAFPISPTSLFDTSLSIPYKAYQVRANIDAEAGVSYTRCISGSHFELFAGYHFGLWFDQNDFFNFIFTTTNVQTASFLDANLPMIDEKYGNLQLQGFILKAAVYF